MWKKKCDKSADELGRNLAAGRRGPVRRARASIHLLCSRPAPGCVDWLGIRIWAAPADRWCPCPDRIAEVSQWELCPWSRCRPSETRSGSGKNRQRTPLPFFYLIFFFTSDTFFFATGKTQTGRWAEPIVTDLQFTAGHQSLHFSFGGQQRRILRPSSFWLGRPEEEPVRATYWFLELSQ